MIFMDIITGKDNKTPDVVRVACALSIMAATVVFLYLAFRTGSASLTEFGVCISTIITATGGSLLLKHNTEPLPQDDGPYTDSTDTALSPKTPQ